MLPLKNQHKMYLPQKKETKILLQQSPVAQGRRAAAKADVLAWVGRNRACARPGLQVIEV